MRFQSLAFALIIGLALAAGVYALIEWVPFGRYPGTRFFDLAAQTIPILLVALAVEAQARHFDLEPRGKLIRIAAVLFLALGQTTAVLVSAGLYQPPRRTFEADLLVVVTAVGLLGGFLAVIIVALRTSRRPLTVQSDSQAVALPTSPPPLGTEPGPKPFAKIAWVAGSVLVVRYLAGLFNRR